MTQKSLQKTGSKPNRSFLTMTGICVFASGLTFAPERAQANDVAQNALVHAMADLVFRRGVAQRIGDVCPELSLNEVQASGMLTAIMTEAQKNFPSQEDWQNALNELRDDEAMGQELKGFFNARGVDWGSEPEAYCALGNTLLNVADTEYGIMLMPLVE